MDIDTIGILGFVFAATSLGALLVEWRTDVLRYVESRDPRRMAGIFRMPDPVRVLADRLRWSVRNAVYLPAIAC
jgi:hypothetical protein